MRREFFCYDLSLLMAGRNHHIDFAVHDSRLFSDMDPRQRAKVFRIARDITEHHGCRYVATLNEDQIQGMEDYLTEDERSGIIAENVVLTLGVKTSFAWGGWALHALAGLTKKRPFNNRANPTNRAGTKIAPGQRGRLE